MLVAQVQLWLTGAVVGSWLAVGAAAEAQDPLLATNFLTALGQLRPAKAVIRSVRDTAPDLFVNLSQRLRGWGYPLETHTAHTEDGYILVLHRIPRGRSAAPATNASASEERAPVLLQHGFIGCSEQWVLGGPDVAPALILADHGYDVWMGNFRGNHFSRKHKLMKPSDPRFWIFSYDEHGMYDVPASIDYVLNATNQKRLYYVGHSMGNAAFYIAASMRPEYNAKVRLCISLSPAIYLEDANVLRIMAANYNYIKASFDLLSTYEILKRSDSLISTFYLTCNKGSYFHNMCAAMVSMVMGIMDLNNATGLCAQLARGLSSDSAYNIVHYGQEIRSGEFRQMDYGVTENLRRYGTSRPAVYPLVNVTAPIAIYGAQPDFVVPTKGIRKLTKVLPNVITTRIIDEKFFNHLDFMSHPRLYNLIMKDVLKLMKEY